MVRSEPLQLEISVVKLVNQLKNLTLAVYFEGKKKKACHLLDKFLQMHGENR